MPRRRRRKRDPTAIHLLPDERFRDPDTGEPEFMPVHMDDVGTGILVRDEPEWDLAWRRLIRRTGDRDFEAWNGFEAWQYMDSERRWRRRSSPWWHCFRHRCHPGTNARRYEWILASPGWEPSKARRGQAG